MIEKLAEFLIQARQNHINKENLDNILLVDNNTYYELINDEYIEKLYDFLNQYVQLSYGVTNFVHDYIETTQHNDLVTVQDVIDFFES